jgi:hypothetical protein
LPDVAQKIKPDRLASHFFQENAALGSDVPKVFQCYFRG